MNVLKYEEDKRKMVAVPILDLLRKIGIDRAVAYTVFGRVLQGIAGLVTLWVLARFLTPDEQGFYFTFASIIGLQVFVELGLSVVLIQFASHEKAHLEWTGEGILAGDQKAKERLASLVQLTFKWYSVASIIIIVCLVPAGYIFFYRQSLNYSEIVWEMPWISTIISFSVFFFITPHLSILEGCGKVKEVAVIRIFQEVAGSLLLWFACITGWGLWSVPLFYIGKSAAAICWITTGWRKRALRFFMETKPTAKINWSEEVFPLQWKLALGWISGYFIFNLFNPVLFVYHGAKVAGQMGMTLAAYAGISTMSMAWINTKAPTFGGLVVKKEYGKLDDLFFRTFWQSLAVIVILLAIFVGIIFFLRQSQYPVSERFLPLLPMLLLAVVSVINHIVFAQATYFRAHKQEPFLGINLIGGIIMALSTFFLGKHYASIGIASGYFVVATVLGLGCGTTIFITKRRIWHGEN